MRTAKIKAKELRINDRIALDSGNYIVTVLCTRTREDKVMAMYRKVDDTNRPIHNLILDPETLVSIIV